MSAKKYRITLDSDEIHVYDYEKSIFNHLEILDIPGISVERIISKNEHDRNLFGPNGLFRLQDNRLIFVKTGNQTKPKFPLTITLIYNPDEVSVPKSVYNQLLRHRDKLAEENTKLSKSARLPPPPPIHSASANTSDALRVELDKLAKENKELRDALDREKNNKQSEQHKNSNVTTILVASIGLFGVLATGLFSYSSKNEEIRNLNQMHAKDLKAKYDADKSTGLVRDAQTNARYLSETINNCIAKLKSIPCIGDYDVLRKECRDLSQKANVKIKPLSEIKDSLNAVSNSSANLLKSLNALSATPEK